MLEDSESLLDIMQDDFTLTSFSTPHLLDSHSLWDQDVSDENSMADLPIPFAVDSHNSELKEDFQKMLSDWHEHLGDLQASDSEDMDVKDLVGLGMHMPKNGPVEIPSDIFEVSPKELKIGEDKSPYITEDRVFSGLSMSFDENLNTFNLENFLEDDDEEEHKFGLIVAEEEDLSDTVTHQTIAEPQAPPKTAVVKTSNGGINCIENFTNKNLSEEESVDVETVVDQIPVLEAGDLKSLLEQFEATEAVNSTFRPSTAAATMTSANPSIVKAVPTSLASYSSSPSPLKKAVKNSPSALPSFSSPSVSSNMSSETNRINLHETIRDALPQEVIERIKASNRRKPISVIPAMPSRRPGRGATRMQVAAATLSRNKLLKLVSGNAKGGESIQLDHDYCSSTASPPTEVAVPKSFYHSNASEYTSEQSSPRSCKDSDESVCAKSVIGENKVYSRLPEYYVVLAPQKALDRGNKNTVKEEVWDKNSRKDSGLESGEVSDASEDTNGTSLSVGSRDLSVSSNNICIKSENRKGGKNIVPSNVDKGVISVDIQKKVDERKKMGNLPRTDRGQSILKDWSTLRPDNTKSKPVQMVSVLKKNNIGCATNLANRQQSLLLSSNKQTNTTNFNNSNLNITNSTCSQTSEEADKIKTEGPKKRKLNLEEYRSRLKGLERNKSKEDQTKPKPISVAVPVCNAVQVELESASKQLEEEKVMCEGEAVNRISSNVNDEKKSRPVMHSVEVQTQTSIFDEDVTKQGMTNERRSRKKQRSKYSSSKRNSSSSSSHSTSSSGSHNHHHRSHIRRRTSRLRSHGGNSVSSSGSQQPRSRSNSSRSSSSYSSYSSRSRSRSRSRSSARRSPSSSHQRAGFPHQRYDHLRPLPYSNGWQSRSRSPPYGPRRNGWMLTEREKQRQVEERRVVYVGRLDEGTSKAELRRRFEQFGPIIDISVHFREHGDNYGFVTFAYKVDAYEAVEHGNDDPNLPRYDLCFGGRRAFCKTRYSDLDGLATSDGPVSSSGYMRPSGYSRRTESQVGDFDLLLREAQAKLRQRKV